MSAIDSAAETAGELALELPVLNVGAHLPARAKSAPNQAVLIVPRARGWESTSYAELSARSDALAHGLARAGLHRGDRVCVFVRPGRDWVALVNALFSLGAVPVMIDPGMGRRGVLACVERMRPRGFVGIPLAHALRLASPSSFRSVEVAITAGAPKLWSGPTLESLAQSTREPFEPARTSATDLAAILFTSGSTGPAKGVAYEHGMFEAQVRSLAALYGLRSASRDLACFPLFALFGAALGLTSVLPRMDFSRPARCAPEEIASALAEHEIASSFGSPAIWRRVAPWCRARGLAFPALERLMIAGAPVEPRLIEDCVALLPRGDVATPYGATEALPVSSASGRDLLGRFRARTENGEGTCVGQIAPGIEMRLVRVTDAPLAEWSDSLEVARGEAGEICVRGPAVTREYALDPEATALAKIRDGDGFWHRMGDLGRLDGDGELWFLGRKSHRLETPRGTLYPVPVENVIDRCERVRRSALVGVGARGAERPVLVVEPQGERALRTRAARETCASEILEFAHAHAASAAAEAVLLHRSLPVDVRHNAKIDRSALKSWAERELR